jgi:hypothetical protein
MVKSIHSQALIGQWRKLKCKAITMLPQIQPSPLKEEAVKEKSVCAILVDI